ncbi:MAG: deoxyribonuclease IV [Methanomicrobiaceae archaeon]|nr:deoxyribonuclease IV [Methanomicrobiaceae archaeon]
MVLRVGCHVSIAGGHDRAVGRAEDIGCNTFQIFTGNPRGWSAKDIDDKSAQNFISEVDRSKISPVVAHMPYLPNFATPRPEVYEKSCAVLLREIRRCGILKIPYLVTHLGSHLGDGREAGVKRTADAISEALDSEKNDVMILLENTSGTKNSIGGTFEDIGEILDAIGRNKRVGTCFDTCHAFAAGYDISTESGLIDTLSDYERLINLKNLKVIHLNDTKGECGRRLDRHEHIGLGKIGDFGIKRIVNHPKLSSLPFILETPVDERRGDKENVAHVRELFEG